MRRRAAARLARTRRQALAAGVDLARDATTSRSSRRRRADQVRGESTPFYLWSRGAHRRIAERLPDVRLIAVVRDPIDRAYSNWMHLWSDGLEPEADFETASPAGRADAARAGRRSGATATSGGTASSSTTSTATSTRSGSWCCATATWSTSPRAAVDRVSRFLGIREGQVDRDPARQLAQLRAAGLAAAVLGPVVRAGARLGQFAPPRGVAAGQRAARSSRCSATAATAHRPRLDAGASASGCWTAFVDDIDLLTGLTGEDFARLALAREPGLLRRARRDGDRDQRTQVTRSCARRGARPRRRSGCAPSGSGTAVA